MQSQFKAEKAIAAIGYLVSETGADLYSVMKMLYLADKQHLQRFGRTICGDHYVAMPKGPVPDRAYNLCKFIRGSRDHFDPLPTAREWLKLEGNAFQLLRAPDIDELSRSDIDALNHAAEIHKAGNWKGVFDASHDDAWRAAWAAAEANNSRCTDMELDAIAATLPNGPALIEYLADRHPGEESETPSVAH